MKVATAAEIREIDRNAVNRFKVPGIVLMENAGKAVACKIKDILGSVTDKKICIFAGKGNNGGDGYVVARHLHNQGAKVKIFLLGDKDSVEGDARTNLDTVMQMGIDILVLSTERDWDKARIAAAFADCLVDAIFGTGFKGEINSYVAQAVEIINMAERPVVAVDIPTGVDADTGQVAGIAVKAAYTVSFALPKPGLLLFPGAQYAGELTVADIGIPSTLLTESHIRQNVITAEYVRSVFPKRSPTAHKGTAGRVCMIAGSRGFTGAASLAAMGAMRAGAGLVTLGIASSLNDIMEVKLTEVMTTPLPETENGAICFDSVLCIEQLVDKNDVLAIGPGLGADEETMRAVRQILMNTERPMVVDADALNALVGYTDILASLRALAILTPHPGEMARLTCLTLQEVNSDRVSVARQAAAEWGNIVVLKGARTVVAFPDGEVYINITGNAGMATGGTGDVLTGVIAALIAQGLSSHDAAVAGVYIHGLAGDITAGNGMVGMTAVDILQAVPLAIRNIHSACDDFGKDILYTAFL